MVPPPPHPIPIPGVNVKVPFWGKMWKNKCCLMIACGFYEKILKWFWFQVYYLKRVSRYSSKFLKKQWTTYLQKQQELTQLSITLHSAPMRSKKQSVTQHELECVPTPSCPRIGRCRNGERLPQHNNPHT